MQPKTRPMLALGAVTAAAAVVTACGSDDGDPVTGADAQALVEESEQTGDAVECAFDDEGVSGVVYTKGDDLSRTDFVVDAEAWLGDVDGLEEFYDFEETSSGESSVLVTGGKSYLWSSESSEGIASDAVSLEDNEGYFAMIGIDADSQYEDMECKPYTGSDKVFEIPKDVEFDDVGSQFTDAMDRYGDMFDGLFDEEYVDMFDDPEMQEFIGQTPGGN